MPNSRPSAVFLGWTFAVALMLTAAFAIYRVSVGMLNHLHEEIAMVNYTDTNR